MRARPIGMKLLPRPLPGRPRAVCLVVFSCLAMPGQPTAGLGGGDAGESLLDEVNHVTGLHWKILTSSAP
jgi:hypothetical protein